MWKTVLRRVLLMIPQLFILSIIVFALGQAMPGDPFTGLITPQTKPEAIEALREKAGLNNPIPVQYKDWMVRILRDGNFGQSYTYKMPVSTLVGNRVANTLWLSLLTVILIYLIAIPLGINAGRYQDSAFDKGVVIYNFISYAIPSFILGLIFLLVFGYKLHWFPTGGSVDLGFKKGTFDYAMNKLYHMILPAITGAVLGTTGTIQYLRNEVIDAKTQDYVKTARSKGVPTDKVYSHHIFRNSFLPIAAFLGFTITGLLSGSVFIETIFSYPGMGELFISSINSRDYAVMNTLVLLYGFLTLLGSLLSDIIMTIVDPRIRIE
ncbi:MAG TPA: peptide ABC transporter permease [Clostridiaceae bacterium]|nr:peptide ABC transporter permease [Clostridiaceae bacterium]HBF77512.1 peptide ABC transporter permease [Clostridiaceae bacterium]HBG39171.1 peptide ABC transporter permease [Clostridiaceae bacterium]HBN29491.1 peptide ABC transporter permease [Clostridiaceae bacterium]HBX47358.1 peptide ABC transporter permease [Clostridiaceae bacterium]